MAADVFDQNREAVPILVVISHKRCSLPTARACGAGLIAWGFAGQSHPPFVVWTRGHVQWQSARVFAIFDTIDLQTRLQDRSEEHTSELQSRPHLVCRLLLEK